MSGAPDGFDLLPVARIAVECERWRVLEALVNALVLA